MRKSKKMTESLFAHILSGAVVTGRMDAVCWGCILLLPATRSKSRTPVVFVDSAEREVFSGLIGPHKDNGITGCLMVRTSKCWIL